MPKIRVGVIYGGPSNEHDVSVASGKAILEHIDSKKYEVVEIFIDREGMWSIADDRPIATDAAIHHLRSVINIALLGLHGTFGEDGHLQALLDEAKISYTGSGFASSKTAFDKAAAQELYEQNGLRVPKWQVIAAPEEAVTIETPLVVKPVAEGSSVGVSIVKKDDELQKALERVFARTERAMIQEYIDGVEVSCGVLERPEPAALTPTELRPVTDDFFSYKAKYEVGGSKELTPPELGKKMIQKIKDMAILAHKVLGCRGYSRTDMFVQGDEIYVIETNTLPGFTPTSILPQQAAHDHISYTELLDILIQQARHD